MRICICIIITDKNKTKISITFLFPCAVTIGRILIFDPCDRLLDSYEVLRHLFHNKRQIFFAFTTRKLVILFECKRENIVFTFIQYGEDLVWSFQFHIWNSEKFNTGCFFQEMPQVHQCKNSLLDIHISNGYIKGRSKKFGQF